jgi:hypothetical protein
MILTWIKALWSGMRSQSALLALCGLVLLAFLTMLWVQSWRLHNLQQEVAEAAVTAAEQRAGAEREARRMESARSRNTLEALNARTAEIHRARTAAVAARTELDGLLDTIAAAGFLPSEPAAACAERAAALGAVLGQCAARYTDLAEKADGHAADARALSAAWPE